MVAYTRLPLPVLARRLRLVALACVVCATAMLLCASGASARTSSCAHATTPIADATHGELQHAVFCLVNHERAAHHLPGLVASPKLDLSAQRWTQSMVRDHAFTHGVQFTSRISAVGFDWQDAGENIATGYTTPRQVVNAWMASPGHCANILDPLYREVGTGVMDRVIPGSSNIDGTWTQDFGRLMSQRALSHDFGPARACSGH